MERAFGIFPAAPGTFTFLWIFGLVIGIILVGVIWLFISLAYQSNHLSVVLADDGLRIGPGMYSRTIPREDINTAGVRVIDLNIESAYKPKWRMNGAGLPGYSAGWFKLQNKEKALLFLTDNSRVVYIPTLKNYAVIVSVSEAEELTEAIQKW